MQILDHISVDWRALISWTTLPQPEQKRVLEALEALSLQPPAQWLAPRVQRLTSNSDHYVLRATDELLVVFQRGNDGSLTILDIVLKEMLERYFATKP